MGLLKDVYLRAVYAGDVKPDKTKLTDGDGLYIKVMPLKDGSVGLYWRFDYAFASKRKTFTIGSYPLIGTTEARKRHRAAKVDLSKGIDPSSQKKAGKLAASGADNFKTVALVWLDKKEGGERHKYMVNKYFSNDIFPVLGRLNIDEVKPMDIVKVVDRVSSRGSLDQARRCGRWLYNIFQYAMTVGKVDRNPADIDLSLIIPTHIPTSHAAILDPAVVGQLLRDIDCYSGYFITRCLLQLAALLMSRPGNLVSMEWSEIDWDAKTWTIEARKMKARQHIKVLNRSVDRHVVPLPRQALAILSELDAMRLGSPYVFPHQRGKNTHMCADTIRVSLRILGYSKDAMTGHGFRAMARTMLEEQLGWDEKLAEMQLNHKVKSHGGAYDRTQHLDKRAEMMQAWADYLDELRVSLPMEAS